MADDRGFGVSAGGPSRALMDRHLEDFGEVKGLAVGTLGNLLAATEAICNHQPVGRSLANGRQEFELTDIHGDVIAVGFEAEGASHAAAAGRGSLEIDAHA